MPLVLHGSSGVPDDDLAAAIAAGMTKINIATQLNKAYTAAVRHCLANDSALVDRGGTVRRGAGAVAARWPGCSACIRGRQEPVSRYRRWNELLELLATAGQLQVEDAAAALGRVRGHGAP